MESLFLGRKTATGPIEEEFFRDDRVEGKVGITIAHSEDHMGDGSMAMRRKEEAAFLMTKGAGQGGDELRICIRVEDFLVGCEAEISAERIHRNGGDKQIVRINLCLSKRTQKTTRHDMFEVAFLTTYWKGKAGVETKGGGLK